MDICMAVQRALSEAEPIVLSAHELALEGPSGACPPSSELLPLLDAPQPAESEHLRATIGGQPVLVDLSGPDGSGRYWTVHLVQRAGHACLGGTTIAWRHLYREEEALKANDLLPLPTLADVDRDGEPELVLFHGAIVQPEWGNAGIVLALPAMTLVRGQWVADTAASRALAGRLAAVYRALAERRGLEAFSPAAQTADAMERFAKGLPCPQTPAPQ